ncbi:MAG: endonuclease [Acidimicrobiia bacterium]|nr:endonuclease [Acidimicrobiia bacterium]
MTGHNRALGASGEAAALAWYLAAGYREVARNWRCRDGELDLLVSRDRLLVFCEVKTRSSDRFGTPAEAITAVKAARIRRLAARYLAESPWPGDLRFDVACVMRGNVEVIEAAF